MLPSYRYHNVEGTGVLTLDRAVDKPLRDYKIYGNSIQDGTPSPDNPVEIQSCGEKTKNLVDISALVGRGAGTTSYTTKEGNTLTLHSLSSTAYIYISASNSKKGLFDRLKPSTTYRIKYSSRFLEGSSSNSQGRIVFVNSSATAKVTFYIGRATTAGQIVTYNGTFKTPSDLSEWHQILIYGAYGEGSRTEIIDWIVTEESETVDSYESYGYKIPIKVNDKVYNVYLDEPLRKKGSYADYIDFRRGKAVKQIKVDDDTGALSIEESLSVLETLIEEDIELPDIKLQKGANVITVETQIQPSNIAVQYYK